MLIAMFHDLFPLQHTLQHTATHYNTLQHTATHCNTLQHTTTHCNTDGALLDMLIAMFRDPFSPADLAEVACDILVNFWRHDGALGVFVCVSERESEREKVCLCVSVCLLCGLCGSILRHIRKCLVTYLCRSVL